MTQTIEMSRTTPAVLRWGLALFGMGMAGIALFELSRAIWPLSIVTPFFGIMLGVGVYMGGMLAAAAIFGPDETWSITSGRLTIRQSLRGTSKQLDYGRGSIVAATVETSEWDSRASTYYLDIRLASGERLKSPEFGTEAKAQAALAVLMAPA